MYARHYPRLITYGMRVLDAYGRHVSTHALACALAVDLLCSLEHGRQPVVTALALGRVAVV